MSVSWSSLAVRLVYIRAVERRLMIRAYAHTDRQWPRPQVLRHSSAPWRRCAASSETRCARGTPSLTNDFVVGAGPCAASTSEHSRCTHDLRTEPLGSRRMKYMCESW